MNIMALHMKTTPCSVITTDLLPQRKRFEYWADVVCQFLNPIEIDSPERDDFNAKLNILKLGETTCFLSEGKNLVTARRTSQLISQANKHAFHLIMRLTGGGALRQGKNTTTLRAGDFVLVDTSQEVVSTMENTHSILLSVPDAFIRTWIPNPEDYVAQVLRGDKGWAAVLSSYLRNLSPDIIVTTKPSQHLLMIEHILSLYLFALEESIFIPKPALFCSTVYDKTDLYVRMYNWLKDNYMDADISAAHIAQEFGVSTREVHRQFALTQKGSTFLETLRAMRMTAAVRMLRDPNFSTMTISEVGYRCGFSDSAYFCRVFRKILGCSPGAFAKAHQNANREEDPSVQE